MACNIDKLMATLSEYGFTIHRSHNCQCGYAHGYHYCYGCCGCHGECCGFCHNHTYDTIQADLYEYITLRIIIDRVNNRILIYIPDDGYSKSRSAKNNSSVMKFIKRYINKSINKCL